MKRQNIALPTLQLATVAFFATTAQADSYCVDQHSKVVAKPNCDNVHRPGHFFVAQGPPGIAVGQVLPKSENARNVAGGFGRRDDNPDCDPNTDPECPGYGG